MKKINLDIKKKLEVVSEAVQRTSDYGKAIAVGVQSGVKEFSDQTKQESYERKLKRYNPLFPTQYQSEDFCVPNLIKIVDDAERRGIDVCEGAIGWLEKKNDVEILCLYDEAVRECGIRFVPAATCDSIYYVDCFDRQQFIRLDKLFDRANDEKIAELHYIAHCLGAKRCYVEINEVEAKKEIAKKKLMQKESVPANGIKSKIETTAENNVERQNVNQRSGKGLAMWSGTQAVKVPELKWFRYDESIKRLIEMRCGGENAIQSLTLELEGAASATMSQKTAVAVDSVIGKIGGKTDARMEKLVEKECRSKLIMQIDF